VVTETVPWARQNARLSRALEDVIAWMAQRCDKTTVSTLLRISWQTVADVVIRVVADHLDGTRLNDLHRIGVDEISYRKGHRYLTVVADHDTPTASVVWAGDGRSTTTLETFYRELGPDRCAQLTAVSLDLGAHYAKATRDHAPDAAICIDPFHLVRLANEAIDTTRRWAWNTARGGRPPADPRTRDHQPLGGPPARHIKNTRWALLKDPAHLTDTQREVLAQLRTQNHILWRAYILKEELRRLYRLPPGIHPDAWLDGWLARACRSRIPAIVKLSKTIRRHRDGILAAINLGLSNSALEGLNNKTRLINHRGYGHHSAAALIAMLYLCSGGITIALPTQT
jgi:transposase